MIDIGYFVPGAESGMGRWEIAPPQPITHAPSGAHLNHEGVPETKRPAPVKILYPPLLCVELD